MADMRVSEWMTPAPITVAPSAPVPKVGELMLHRRIRHLPGVGGGRPCGRHPPPAAASLSVQEVRYLLDRLRVRSLMTRPVITVASREPIAEAVRLMLENRIGGLPVMEGEPLGGILTAAAGC